MADDRTTTWQPGRTARERAASGRRIVCIWRSAREPVLSWIAQTGPRAGEWTASFSAALKLHLTGEPLAWIDLPTRPTAAELEALNG